jgi:beta-phosphoglucomutase-like phosphatase (HAD superfamily)
MMTRAEIPLAMTFDFDGTILESEKLARRCFLATCNEVYGADVAIYNRCVGTSQVHTDGIKRAGFGPKFLFEATLAHWAHLDEQEIATTPIALKEGISDLLA